MTLATKEQIISQIINLNESYRPLSEYKLHQVCIGSSGHNEYSYRRNRIFPFTFWPTEYEFSNEGKVRAVCGANKQDLMRDLFYHWMTNFVELSTITSLREAIVNPDSGASFATTIAVNKYIQSHPEYTETNIKSLFVGSKWRWIKLTNGDYVQQTLYGSEYTTDRGKVCLFTACCSSDFFSGVSVTSLLSFSDWLSKKINTINRIIIETPRELLSYNTRATNHFSFKPSPKKLFHTFLGVELELENHSAAEWKTLDILQNHAIFKRDGSVSNGVEICTTPATLDVHKEEFEKFFTGIKTNKSKFKNMPNCGMHVHIDRSKLSTLHIANIYQFINNKENRINITNIAGRQPNTYCLHHEVGYDHFTQQGNRDRYRMVNLQPEKTIEIRIFASTINYQDFCKRLEFVQAVVDYTRPGELTIPVSKVPLWSHFVEYIKPKRKLYPTLVASIHGEKPTYVSN